MAEILAYVIVGAVTSLIIQVIKRLSGASSWKALGLAIGVSLLVAALYEAIRVTTYWDNFVNILVYSSAIYAVLIKRLEEK